MNLQSVSGVEEKKQTLTNKLMPFLALAIAGAAILAIFWGVWSIFSHIPEIRGISRIVLDVTGAAFFLPILFLYSLKIVGLYQIFSDKRKEDELPVSLKGFVKALWKNYFWLFRIGIFLVLDFIVSIRLSFASGIVVIAIIVCHPSWRRQIFSALFEMKHRESTEEIKIDEIES